MNTTLKALAAAAALVATAGAQATILFVDNFNAPTTLLTVEDFTTSGGAEWQIAPGTTLVAPNIATSRLIGAELLTELTPMSGASARVRVGGPAGTYRANVDTGATGKAYVQWTIPSVPLTSLVGNSYFFQLLASTTGIGGDTSVKFSFNGLGDANLANDFTINTSFSELTNNSGNTATFALSATQAGLLIPGGTLTLEFGLSEGSSFTIDQFSVQVPEPSSLALAGLALLGAGFAARRRKTK